MSRGAPLTPDHSKQRKLAAATKIQCNQNQSIKHQNKRISGPCHSPKGAGQRRPGHPEPPRGGAASERRGAVGSTSLIPWASCSGRAGPDCICCTSSCLRMRCPRKQEARRPCSSRQSPLSTSRQLPLRAMWEMLRFSWLASQSQGTLLFQPLTFTFMAQGACLPLAAPRL